MGVSPKGTVKLSDGSEVTVDVSTLTTNEWRRFWDNGFTSDADFDVICRLTGWTPEALGAMLRDDFRRVTQKIVDLSNRPLDNPN